MMLQARAVLLVTATVVPAPKDTTLRVQSQPLHVYVAAKAPRRIFLDGKRITIVYE